MFDKKALVIEPLKRLAMRIDYIPHIRKLSIQRINFWGQIVNEMWDLSEVEHVEYES